jgi:hypothetical protein
MDRKRGSRRRGRATLSSMPALALALRARTVELPHCSSSTDDCLTPLYPTTATSTSTPHVSSLLSLYPLPSASGKRPSPCHEPSRRQTPDQLRFVCENGREYYYSRMKEEREMKKLSTSTIRKRSALRCSSWTTSSSSSNATRTVTPEEAHRRLKFFGSHQEALV